MTDNPIETIEVHNCYTLYELNEDGSRAKNPLLNFFRPQDWGDQERWRYYQCQIEFESNGKKFINNCHVWREIDCPIPEAFQHIASSLFLVLIPGRKPQFCGKDYLDTDDFWEKEWGEMPPYFEDEDNYFES